MSIEFSTVAQNASQHPDQPKIIIVHKTDDIGQSIRSFKLELLENPNIISVSNTNQLMGQPFGNSVFLIAGGSGEENFLLWRLVTDPDFITTYQVEMVAGRYFEEGREADQQGCILNEAAVKTLGFDDPVGKELMAPGGDEIRRVQVLGVMRDFHYESMHQVIRPLVVFPFQPDGFSRYLAVRIQPGTAREALVSIENTWRKFAQNQAFEYEFFDDHFARVYLAEERTVQILFSFSILAVIIASLGLFGLAAFIAEQRTKEIGIRKVMGATVSGIIVLLIKQFTKWIIIANCIAWPVAYFVMKRWLQNFAYQAPVTIWIFLGSAVVALLIAFVTVSYQSIRAALANPVNSLRYE